jgi:monoamine oxidase
MGFIEGHDGRVAARMTAAERRQGVVDSFARYFGDKARAVEQYVEMSWAAQPYARGCYAGFFPPGVWSDFGPELREPVGRVHWAGTETATEWNGYLDGAIRSGHRVAAEVLAAGGGELPQTPAGPTVHRPPLAATGADELVEAAGAAALTAAAASSRRRRLS